MHGIDELERGGIRSPSDHDWKGAHECQNATDTYRAFPAGWT
jgi:hypothetical protein